MYQVPGMCSNQCFFCYAIMHKMLISLSLVIQELRSSITEGVVGNQRGCTLLTKKKNGSKQWMCYFLICLVQIIVYMNTRRQSTVWWYQAKFHLQNTNMKSGKNPSWSVNTNVQKLAAAQQPQPQPQPQHHNSNASAQPQQHH